MINLTKDPTCQKAEEIVNSLLKLARENPGQAVAIIDDGKGDYRVSVLNIFPTEEDWYTKPVPLSRLHELSATRK